VVNYRKRYALDSARVNLPRGTAALCRLALLKLLGESDEDFFRPANVAESIRVFIPHDFTDELRAMLAEPRYRVVDVVDGEHDAQVTERVHRGVSVIGDNAWGEES